MYKIFYNLVQIIWVLDVLDLPGLEFLDTTYPINGLAWFIILFILLDSPREGDSH